MTLPDAFGRVRSSGLFVKVRVFKSRFRRHAFMRDGCAWFVSALLLWSALDCRAETQSQFLAKATYEGLFSEAEQVAHASSGFIKLNLTSRGSFSASIQRNGKRSSFSGVFDQNGTASSAVSNRDGMVAISLAMDLNAGGSILAGTVTDGQWTARLTAVRVASYSRQQPAAAAGRYSLVVPSNSDPTLPGGDSYATVLVDARGNVRLTGSLADHTPISQAAHVSENDSWPLAIPLYGGHGSIQGWISLTGTNSEGEPEIELSGEVNWIKPLVSDRNAYYPDGFVVQKRAVGVRYTKPPEGPGSISLLDKDYNGFLAQPLLMHSNLLHSKRWTLTESGYRWNLVLMPSTGFFHGNVSRIGASQEIPFSGVLLRTNGGTGYYLIEHETRVAGLVMDSALQYSTNTPVAQPPPRPPPLPHFPELPPPVPFWPQLPPLPEEPTLPPATPNPGPSYGVVISTTPRLYQEYIFSPQRQQLLPLQQLLPPAGGVTMPGRP